jgi:hypothetical protein
MRLSGFGAVLLAIVGMALVPATADAAVFTLNTCVSGDCGSFSGSVTITITDNLSDPNDVNFGVANNSNGDVDYLKFNYVPTPTGSGVVTNFTTAGSVGAPSASFGSGTDAGLSYNVNVNFPNSASVRFDAGEAVSFTLGSTSNFNFNSGSFSPVLGHIISLSIGGQGVKITDGGGGSSGGGGQTVPEPASMVLFGLAALAVGRRLRRKV